MESRATFACQEFHRVVEGTFVKVLGFYRSNRACNLLFGSESIADHHHLVERLNGWFQSYIHRSLRSDRDFSGFIPNEAEYEHRPLQYIEGIFPIHIGDTSGLGSFY